MDLEDYLRQFHLSDPEPALKPRILSAPAHPPAKKRWPWLLGAAAAVLLTAGLGAWLGMGWFSEKPAGVGSDSDLVAVSILGGRGRVLPMAAGTRFTILDSERGHVQLESGEVYLELEPGTSGAEVRTPAGTARALGTRFYAHYAGAAQSLLAVAVLGGNVEVDNAHGQTICTAGEVALAQPDSAPHTHTQGPGGQDSGFCPFVSSLGLIYRVEVQAELRLTEEQKTRLQRPGADERRAICRFFQSLHGLPRAERARKAHEFSDQLDRKVGEVLTAAQGKRLRQIGCQQESYFALLRPEASAAVQVTAEQGERIRAILADFTRIRSTQLEEAPSPERTRKISAAWNKALGQVERLLSAAQCERWKELAGPALALPPRF